MKLDRKNTKSRERKRGGTKRVSAISLEALLRPKDYANESDFLKGVRFIIFFFMLFGLAYALLAFTPMKSSLGWLAAQTSHTALETLGVQTQIGILPNGNYSLNSDGFVAELNEACAALIEIAILFGIVFASFERTIRQRAEGFAIGLGLLLVLNPVRIALSIISLNAFVHDVLFRLTLIITIVGFYAAWYYGDWFKEKARSARARGRS